MNARLVLSMCVCVCARFPLVLALFSYWAPGWPQLFHDVWGLRVLVARGVFYFVTRLFCSHVICTVCVHCFVYDFVLSQSYFACQWCCFVLVLFSAVLSSCIWANVCVLFAPGFVLSCSWFPSVYFARSQILFMQAFRCV